MDMTRRFRLAVGILTTASLLDLSPAAAQSVPLFPAQVSSANIDGLFGTVTAQEETTDIPLPGINGSAVLHSRVIRAATGSRAEGRTTYQYSVDLTGAATFVDVSCVTNLSVKFGPVEKLPYAAGTVLRDVYAITQGVPTNQISFSSAVQTGDVVTFTFAQPICAAGGGFDGKRSFFFGLASLDPPARGVTVQIDAIGLDDMRVKSFGPLR
jgi:hypothetical protein